VKTAAERFETEFLNDPDYAEDGVYYSNGTPGKVIPLVVFRNKFRQKAQYGNRGTQSQRFEYDIEIGISRGTLGITTVHTNIDTVELPQDVGDDTLTKFNVTAIIEQDAGFFKLGLRK
jgi:hypothetical protein